MTFGLVHGVWHAGACWELLVGELTRGGDERLTPALPLEDLAATFEDDAASAGDCIGPSRARPPNRDGRPIRSGSRSNHMTPLRY